MTRALPRLCAALACAGLPLAAPAADLPTGGGAGTRTFILSSVYIAATDDAGACPRLTPGAPEVFLHSLPPAQQQQFATPDKHVALFRLMQEQLGFRWFRMLPRAVYEKAGDKRPGWQVLPIDGTPASANIDEVRAAADIPAGKGAIVFNHTVVAYDSCTNPEDFPMLNQGFQPYTGKTAFGMNLDNRSDPSDFTSPSGAHNVDNQLWRVLGCMKHFREFGNPKMMDKTLFSVAAPTLIEITGIDDLRNDNDVEVTVYASTDPLVADNRGRALADVSYSTDPNPELTARTHGRIVDGVLTTDPVDIRLRYREQIIDNTRVLRGARIQATLKPDGSLAGGFYGYYTLTSFYDSVKQMTQLGANNSSVSCATVHAAVQHYADGYPDPKTGRNTAISSALNFVGVPAFAIQSSARPALTAGY